MLFMDFDPSYIPNPDPAYHYLWVPLNQDVLADYIFSGYEFVVKEEEVKKLFGEQIATVVRMSDGRVRRGDTVLLRCPMERWERIQEFLKQQADDQKRASETSFYNTIDSIGHRGIKPFIMSNEEYEDRRAFETRETNNRVGYTAPVEQPKIAAKSKAKKEE